VRYCWLKPLKHGLVAAPQDWLYSSVHRDVRYRGEMDFLMPSDRRAGV
jgi:putative transposase